MSFVNNVNNLIRALLGVKPKVIHTVPIDKDSMRDETVKAVQLENQALKAELLRKVAREKIKKTEQRKKEIEDEVIKKLYEQKEEFHKKKKKKRTSLFKLFHYKKFPKIKVKSRDGVHNFGYLLDIKIIEGNKLALFVEDKDKPEGSMICAGTSLNQIFFKPMALGTEVFEANRILIPYDENGNYAPDIDEILIPDVVPNVDYNPQLTDSEDNPRYHIATENQVQFLQAILEREEIVQDQKSEIARLEDAMSQMKRRLDKYRRDILIYQNAQNVSSAEMSEATKMSMDAMANMGEWNRKIASLQEYNVFMESMNKGLQETAEMLRTKLDLKEGNETMELAYDRIIQLMRSTYAFKPKDPATPSEEMKQREVV